MRCSPRRIVSSVGPEHPLRHPLREAARRTERQQQKLSREETIMAVSIATGIVDPEARLSSERVVDMDPKIGLKETDNAQFMTILKNLPSDDATQVEVRWLEDQLFPNRTTLGTSANSANSGTTSTFAVATGTGAYFRANDILYVEATGEKAEVVSIST